jgi:hypothetical protein
MSNIPKAANSGSDKMHLDEFDPEADDWYIMQQALEQGSDDPHSALRAFRHQPPAQAELAMRQGGNGGAAATSPLAEAARPANGWPPGRARAIAQFIFANSFCPIPEIAMTATIALLAGVCGRAYRTYTGKDLALYIILVAKSGVGKDSIHEVMPRLLEMADRPTLPAARHCIRSCYGNLASSTSRVSLGRNSNGWGILLIRQCRTCER